MAVNARERWRVAVGAALGVAVTALLCRAGAPVSPWLVAPIGASAVLVFGVPASPFAQPWAVVGGNTLSALVGIACAGLFGGAPWVAGLAVGLAILTMFGLRCLHPPGGACALLAVMGGLHDPAFAAFPVLANSLLLVAGGMAYNLATGRRYPHGQQRAPAAAAAAGHRPVPGFSDADLDAVLARYNQVLDVSRDDLQALLEQAELQAYRRKLGGLRCADVMSREPLAVEYGTPLQQAWSLLRQHRIKALPVVDRARRVTGIVTLADFMRGAELDLHQGWSERLRALIRPSTTTHSDKAEVVGQIMTRQVRVASADRPIGELVPLFAATGHHHIPIIDAEQRLVGILTQSDLVAALSHG
ncbi:HPP family protein [Ideonella sp. BN130291]|uniref:HPP family protein n=1 Tax=Ideonella sp. BN130291 TaxID=3112940 RepID=UPI002E2545F9|nr:HPP family protein [Ideonella sp. BN130291]